MPMVKHNSTCVFSAAAAYFSNAAMTRCENLPAPSPPELDLMGRTISVVFWLAVILFLVVGTVWVLKKILGFKHLAGISGKTIRILEIHYFDPKKAIALVKVLDRAFIIGFSDASISTLGELTPEESARVEDVRRTESSPFGNILSRVIKAPQGNAEHRVAGTKGYAKDIPFES